jgi:hypothetical protein
VVENRIKGLRADWEKQVATLNSEREALNARLTAIQIDQGVITAATKRGLRPTAIADITSRARSVFKLANGVPRAFEADGQSVRYEDTPLSLADACLVRFSELHSDCKVFTLDMDFRRYRRHGRQAIPLLAPE